MALVASPPTFIYADLDGFLEFSDTSLLMPAFGFAPPFIRLSEKPGVGEELDMLPASGTIHRTETCKKTPKRNAKLRGLFSYGFLDPAQHTICAPLPADFCFLTTICLSTCVLSAGTCEMMPTILFPSVRLLSARMTC